MWLPLPWETLRLSSLKPPVSPHRCALPCRRWARAGTQCLQRGLPFDWFIDCARQYQEWAGVQQTPVPALSLSLWPPNTLPGAGQDKDLEKMEFRVCVLGERGWGHPSINPADPRSLLSGPALLSVSQARGMDGQGPVCTKGKERAESIRAFLPTLQGVRGLCPVEDPPIMPARSLCCPLQRQSRWLPVRYALRLRKGSSATPSLCLFCA